MKKLSLYILLILSCFLLIGCNKNNEEENKSEEETTDINIISTDDTIVFKSSDNIYTTFYYDGETLTKVIMTSIFDTEEEADAAVELFSGEDFVDMYTNIKKDGTKVTLNYASDYFEYYAKYTKTEMEYFMNETGYEVEK